MIAKKNKKKDEKSELEKYEENIQSMRSWVRKVEQSANSLSGRLKAVEERISSSNRVNPLVSSDLSKTGNRLGSNPLAENVENEELLDFSNDLLDEINVVKEELACQQGQIMSFESKMDDLNSSLEDAKKEILGRIEAEKKVLDDVSSRVEKVEDRSPFYMRLGRLEFPLEIAGVLSGFIAFIAAVLMYYDMKLLLISPPFLISVGILFFAAALFKSIKASGILRKKKNHVVYRATINDKSEGFEEKYVA
jgi:tetrahydromethanopterin S-methyltransferase subunit F